MQYFYKLSIPGLFIEAYIFFCKNHNGPFKIIELIHTQQCIDKFRKKLSWALAASEYSLILFSQLRAHTISSLFVEKYSQCFLCSPENPTASI